MIDRSHVDALRAAAWLRKPHCIVPSIVVLLALIVLAISFLHIRKGNASGYIMLGLALVPLALHARGTAKRRRLERAAHAASNNCCPHCLFDLSGILGTERRPECEQSIDLEPLKREWETGLNA
jgi:hypothetical protein